MTLDNAIHEAFVGLFRKEARLFTANARSHRSNEMYNKDPTNDLKYPACSSSNMTGSDCSWKRAEQLGLFAILGFLPSLYWINFSITSFTFLEDGVTRTPSSTNVYFLFKNNLLTKFASYLKANSEVLFEFREELLVDP